MTHSPSSPAASPSSGPGKQRTRNAQAQADLRVRRKAYIKTLEDTVSSLEACVRQLRSQNADLTRQLPSSSSSAAATVAAKVDGEKCACDGWQEVRAENARLREMLSDAGLMSAAVEHQVDGGECESPASASSSSTTTTKASATKHERDWSSTCSITTKKRKLSKMQAFAQQVDSQLGSALTAMSSSPSQAYAPFVDDSVFYLQDSGEGLMGKTPSSSSSRGESVASHRSPKTPRFDSALLAMHDEKSHCGPTDSSVAMTGVQPAWYETPIVLAPVSTSAVAAPPLAEQPMISQQAAPTWMLRQHLPVAATWFEPDYTCTSASISFARCSPPRPSLRRRPGLPVRSLWNLLS